MVSRKSPRSRESRLALARAGRRRAPPDFSYPRPSHEMPPPANARSQRISERLRRPFAEQIPRDSSVSLALGGRFGSRRKLRARRIANVYFRRQLELARPGLAADQLSPDRIAPEASPLLRRRFQSGMS